MRVRARAAAEQLQAQEADTAVDDNGDCVDTRDTLLRQARPASARQRGEEARRGTVIAGAGEALERPCAHEPDAAEAAAIAHAEVSIQHAAGQCMKELRRLQVCLCVCIYVYMCVCVCVYSGICFFIHCGLYMLVCTLPYTYARRRGVCVYMCIYTPSYTAIYMDATAAVCVFRYIYAPSYTAMCVCMCVRVCVVCVCGGYRGYRAVCVCVCVRARCVCVCVCVCSRCVHTHTHTHVRVSVCLTVWLSVSLCVYTAAAGAAGHG